ncbi:uncharacterized protein P884DRAFT_212954 [Thermothelomyces heterothallicus CBS 202.75]|uniref:uncharacterized protein n=1 Tax=Thermothelomyces heterothallicus CBS 202.75 TaxID=1149848 RepID=UPI003742AA45
MGASRAAINGAPEFLRDLALQVEILACLHWLVEFQILACIPLEESVLLKDLADLAGVPAGQLARVVRLTASRGFLHEPEADHVAHTKLSAQFITNQSLLDATVFMAECAAPAALQMSFATHRFGGASAANPTGAGAGVAVAAAADGAFDLAFATQDPSSHGADRERSRMRRGWSAYLAHLSGSHGESEVVNALLRLSWSNLGNACVVEVGAHSASLARALAHHCPNLRLVVQIDRKAQQQPSPSPAPVSMWNGILSGFFGQDEVADHLAPPPQEGSPSSSGSGSGANHPGVTVTYRAAGMPQPITDAAAYIIHLTPPPPSGGGVEGGRTLRTQLDEYVGLLRASRGIMLVLTADVLPEPGSMPNPEVEAVARARDLSMFQLSNRGAVELADLLGIINSLGDGFGKLTVINKLRAPDGLVLVLVVKYQAC